MSQRLPIPGSDNGTWGDILNAYLSVSLASDGTLNPNVVGTSQIQNNAVTNAQLDSPTQTTLSAVASKYVKPNGGIPLSDLSATGTASSSTYLRGDNTWSTPAAGVTLDSTSTDIQPDTVTGSAVAGSTGKAADSGHQHPLVSHDHSTVNKGGQLNPTTALTATGTASSTTFLRGDNTWNTPPSASNATTSSPGLVQLAGDLGGTSTTATAPTLANTTNVQSVVNTIVGTNATVTGALQKTNNLSDGLPKKLCVNSMP